MFKLFLAVVVICSTTYCTILPPALTGQMIRDLYPVYKADFAMMAAQWIINGSVSNSIATYQCYQPYLGGLGAVGPQGSFKRTYTTLPFHTNLDLSIHIRIKDRKYSDPGDLFRVKIDNEYFKAFNITAMSFSAGDLCGGSDLTLLLKNISHSSSSMTIQIFWEMKSLSENPTFAIRDVALSFRNTTSSYTCPTGFYPSNGFCQSCDLSCQDCFGPSTTHCSPCQWGDTLLAGQCVQCPSNCSLCSGPNEGQCLLCNNGYTLDVDGTCIPEDQPCNAYYYVIRDNSALNYSYSIRVCAQSCASGEQIMFQNHTCIPIAPPNYPDYFVYPDQNPGSNNGNNYCETILHEYYDLANCTNPDNGCGADEFRLSDGSCSTWCVLPYTSSVIGYSAYCNLNTTNSTDQGTNPNNQTENYCEIIPGFYYDYANCTNPNNECGANEFKYLDGECSEWCFHPYSSIVSNYSAYCILNSNSNSNSNPGSGSGSGSNPNSNPNSSNSTNNPKIILQLYIRYNMSLVDFNSQDGLSKFVEQLALVLGVDPSDIVVVDVREGSTIIESQVILISASSDDSTTVSEAQEMSNRYSNAISNKQLNIFEGVDVLDYKSSIQIKNSTDSQIQVLNSSSDAVGIGVGVGVGVAILVVAIGGYFFYRRYRTRQEVETVKIEVFQARANESQDDQNYQNDQEANDGSFAVIKDVIGSRINSRQERDMHLVNNMEDIEKNDQEQEQEQGQIVEDEETPIQFEPLPNLDNVDIDIAI